MHKDARDLDVHAGSRCGVPVVQFVRVAPSAFYSQDPRRIWHGPAWGYKILQGSDVNVFLTMGRPRGERNDELAAFQGAGLSTRTEHPLFTELWIRSDSTSLTPIIIAVLTQPGELHSFGSVVLASGSGAPGAQDVNLLNINGTVQTSMDFTGLHAALTFAAPATASVGAASAQILAAATRRLVYFRIVTASRRISFGFGSPAVLDSGVTIASGVSAESNNWVAIGGADSRISSAINAIADQATTNLAIQVAT